eukprot:CAMPEP_0174712506 /NCGR_PEP_ID=MMETSP1094-20130205/13481_1 /TAXON_ID=156173 /ORGANISM="Chrysochromulina brevifilum, Strain UTEX LB 985" /LENGTH=76 /DNA_ID=CAMNT_0015911581 /DNA_START=214 /DNA_END=444 /DNA_ORIENTATION=+
MTTWTNGSLTYWCLSSCEAWWRAGMTNVVEGHCRGVWGQGGTFKARGLAHLTTMAPPSTARLCLWSTKFATVHRIS